jgi:hypothetical protein
MLFSGVKKQILDDLSILGLKKNFFRLNNLTKLVETYILSHAYVH